MTFRDEFDDESESSPYVDDINHHLSSEDEKLVTESHGRDGFWSGLWMTWGRLVPCALRYRFLRIDLDAPKEKVTPGEEIPIEVRITNKAPTTIPVSLRCRTFWGWSIDGFQEGTDIDLYTSEPKIMGIRGHQTYSLSRKWNGYIEYMDGLNPRFEPLSSGKHTLKVWINISQSERFGLYDSVSIEIKR